MASDKLILVMTRRDALVAGAVATAAIAMPMRHALAAITHTEGKHNMTESFVTTKDGVDIFFKDWGRSALAANRAQFFLDVPAGPFYGFNREGAKASQGVVHNWWRQGMMGGAKAHYDGIKAFSETDQTEDLKAITVPTLVMHGDDDQVVPIADAGELSAKLLQNGSLKVYKSYSHGMLTVNAGVINPDLLAFVKA